jgi:acetolactate synthase-1/2/3 large subunit
VGCRFADESTSSYRRGVTYSIPPTKLIHIDVDPQEIGKNYPVEIGVVGDAKAVLGQLADALSAEKVGARKDYIEEIARRREEWFRSLDKWRLSDRTPVTISRALKEAREFLSRDAIVVSSSGHSQAQMLQEFTFYEPRTNITTGGFSTMGFSLPAAMGAKLAAPERQVAAIMGDGDFLMSVQELATAAQHEIPVVALVMNNASWMSIADLQREALGADHVYAVHLSRDGADGPDLRAISAGFGCYSERVSSPDEVRPALDRAFESGRPAVIEVMVNREYPYSGGKAVGWWDVPVPAYLSDIRAQYEKARSEEML